MAENLEGLVERLLARANSAAGSLRFDYHDLLLEAADALTRLSARLAAALDMHAALRARLVEVERSNANAVQAAEKWGERADAAERDMNTKIGTAVHRALESLAVCEEHFEYASGGPDKCLVCFALAERARAERLEKALRKICAGSYMCYAHTGEDHPDDCAVGIARAALSAPEGTEEGTR